MEKARKRTPYDGRRNDWFDFARRQAEFYANAEQYITNLEVELGMIDETVSALMEEIENGRRNPIHGYRMFRQLKQVRRLRTEKERELRMLCSLTDILDMGVMESVTRQSFEEVEAIHAETLAGADIDEYEAEDETAEDAIFEIVNDMTCTDEMCEIINFPA